MAVLRQIAQTIPPPPPDISLNLSNWLNSTIGSLQGAVYGINNYIEDVLGTESGDVLSGIFDTADFTITSGVVYVKDTGINHNGLTNTHNLTTHIDHSLITNLTTGDPHTQYMLRVDDAPTVESLDTYLVAHYKMDDNAASTVVIDSKGYSNGTSVRNTNLMHTTGQIGGALEFDGASDYVDTNQTFETTFQDSFTISLWVKPVDGQSSTQIIMGFDAQEDEDCVLWIYLLNGNVFCYYPLNTGIFGSNVVFNNGQETWHLVTIIVSQFDAANISRKIYFDGVLNTTDTDPYIMSNWNGSSKIFIGALNELGNEIATGFFAGLLDDVRIYNKALDADEVLALYNWGKSNYYEAGDDATFASITDTGLTAGRIPYVGAGGLITDTSNLLWDNTNQQLRANGTIWSYGDTGSTPMSGAGTRFMWIPAKGALRAGYVDSGQWNDENIGTDSVAFGYNTTASASYSTAIGYGFTNSTASSFAVGFGAIDLLITSNSANFQDCAIQTTGAISGASLALTTPLPVSSGGTGRATSTTAYGLIAAGTTATGEHQTLAVGSSGQILTSQGAALPAWTTATYPATAAGTGTILRADGTNWAATAATYPTTTTVNQILYSTSTNVIGSSANLTFDGSALTITGTLAAAHTTIDTTLLLQSGSITDSSGAITFDNENLLTTGTLGAGHTIITGAAIDDYPLTINQGYAFRGIKIVGQPPYTANNFVMRINSVGSGDFDTTNNLTFGSNATAMYFMGNARGVVSFFEYAESGENRTFRIHGYPTGLSNVYGQFQVVNISGNPWFQFSTTGSGLSFSNIVLAADKIAFTQTDNNEYIDSLADGYMDYGATTGHRFLIGGTEQVNIIDGVLQPKTTNDIDLGTSLLLYKDIWETGKHYFRDSAIYINSADDGHLDLVADVAIDFNVNSFYLGNSDSSVSVNFYGANVNGLFAWNGNAAGDRFEFSDDILINSGESIYFANTASFINYGNIDGIADGLRIEDDTIMEIDAPQVRLGADGAGAGKGIYCRTSLVPIKLANNPTVNATYGIIGEIAFLDSDSTWYGKITNTGSNTDWVALAIV